MRIPLWLRTTGITLLGVAYALGYVTATVIRCLGHVVTGIRATIALLLIAAARLLWP